MKNIAFVFLVVSSLFLYTKVSANSYIKIGDKAPDFSLTDPSGKVISLHDLQGKLILLDFWASWCGPCRDANKELINVYSKFHAQGLEIFSVSLDKKMEPWVNAIKNDKLDWPYHGSDFKEWESAPSLLYQIDALPSTFLIDDNGIIIDKNLDEYELDKKLQFIFNEQINFYPKIATSKIFLTGKTKYEITDLSGKEIIKGKGDEIDITGIQAGEYKIKYENINCSFTKKISNQGLTTFFPESATDYLTLSKESDFEIIDSRGRTVKKGTNKSVDVSNLKTGLYYLSIGGNIHKFYKK